MMSSHNHNVNGFDELMVKVIKGLPNMCQALWTELMVKVIKGLLTCAKHSEQDPRLALLIYCTMPVDSHLPSPVEFLQQWKLCTTMPQYIWPIDLHVMDVLDNLNKSAHNESAHRNQKVHIRRLYTMLGSLSLYGLMPRPWLPSTVKWHSQHIFCLITVCGCGTYWETDNHLKQCHSDASHKPEHVMLALDLPAAPYCHTHDIKCCPTMPAKVVPQQTTVTASWTPKNISNIALPYHLEHKVPCTCHVSH